MTRVAVVKFDGTNCDRETAHAFNLVGAQAEIVRLESLVAGQDPVTEEPVSLSDYDIMALPGGFSSGDYIRAGAVAAHRLKTELGDQVAEFTTEGKPIIGICNGFQVLVKAGLLPNIKGDTTQEVGLGYNESGRFQCQWVTMAVPKNSNCIWTYRIETIDLPMAHGEGRFTAPPEIIAQLHAEGMVAVQYASPEGTVDQAYNPNGSVDSIAGISDDSGLIFGLMPHPERYNMPGNHPLVGLQRVLDRDYINPTEPVTKERIVKVGMLPEKGQGLQIFQNAVDYVNAQRGNN